MKELDSLLFKSVNKNVSKVENLISLSGGYDSSAILGYMKKNKSNLNINCFNYSYGKIFSLSDIDIARKTCGQNDIKLREYKMYSSGILNNLKLNAIVGQGIANICDEIDCIEKINGDIKYNASMFFGDEVFGTDDEFLVNKKDVLKSLRIYDFNNLKFMKNFIISNKLSSIEKQSFLFYKKLYKIKNNNLSSFDLKQIYYYKYRVTCVLSRWRDLFYSSYFDYYNPFLDNNIIDFIRNLSFKDRKDRKLFIKTIKNNNKNIFNKIPRAKFPNKISDKEYYSKLVNEIKSENYFSSMTSIINRYIDLKKLEFKINNLSSFNLFKLNKFQYYSRRVIKKSKILKFIFYKISFFNIEYVGLVDFTKRVIVLDNIFKKMELDK